MVYKSSTIWHNLRILHRNGMRVIKKEIKIKLKTLLIVQDKEERRMLNVIKKILKTLDHNMKLLNLLSKMTIAHHFQQAIGLFNSEHTAVKRSLSVMSLVESTLCKLLMINTGLDSLQLLKIKQMARASTKSREYRIKIIIVLKVGINNNQTIV
jgi:hypothetical protein